MADSPRDERFAEGFLDDFFAEADEHLAAIRRNLLALDAAVASGRAPKAALDEMFRSFHSLKGISGMVGLEQAEGLAHQMESYLRALGEGHATLTADGLEALIEGTRALEDVVAARRHAASPPDVGPAQRLLAAIIPAVPHVAPAARPVPAPDAHPAPAPRHAWLVSFEPSQELLARGINVNVVRERLQTVGAIVESRPRVTPSSGIAFEFVVASDASADVFESWRADGISAQHLERDAPVAVAETIAAPSAPPPVAPPGRMVRVDLARLDEVMQIVGDIVISRSRLQRALSAVEHELPQADWRMLEEIDETLERELRVLRERVMRVRLVPIREIFSRMPFVVRDLARDNGKQVRLELRGQDTEIDKFLIERMMDPILHLVRNAISHGIETPSERVERGTPATGTVSLSAATIGEMVVIEIEDDGNGVDIAAVMQRARERGLEVPNESDPATVLDLLCAPGFSTREQADRASGRGVGMGVVKDAVEQLSGTLELQTQPGKCARFTITLPVTLAIIDALVCKIGTHLFAVPQPAVREVLEVDLNSVRGLERNEIVPYRDSVLPLVRVADLLGFPRSGGDGRLHAFVVGTGLQAVALSVDRVIGQREIVVRAVADPLIRTEGISGATELGDGRPVLILDPIALTRMARRGKQRAVASSE